MKTLIEYITESIKKLHPGVKGIIVFDIDDTILKVDSSAIAIYKKEPGKPVRKLTTEEFAKDPDAADPTKKSWFDLRDFRDPHKVYNSIVNGMPLIKNLRIMDSYIGAGYDFCFLTARACELVVKTALNRFLKVKNPDGSLKSLGETFKKSLSHAINDEYKMYPGKNDAEKKANVLKKLCTEYDRVIFVDDDEKNIRQAKSLNIRNLKVIKAWDE